MSKSKTNPTASTPQLDDVIMELEELDIWDVTDPADQMFWEEFFKVEDVLEMSDELEAPSFTITVQNHQTGEVKTFTNIKLKPSRKTVRC